VQRHENFILAAISSPTAPAHKAILMEAGRHK